MTSPHGDLAATLATIAAALDGLSVPWAIGGSFASTVYGEPRATNDVDVVALLRREHVERLLDALDLEYLRTVAHDAGLEGTLQRALHAAGRGARTEP